MKNPCVLRLAAHAALVVSFSVALAATGSANMNGVTGRSGKDNGFYCRNCHAGGTVPTVAFEGPQAMEPGSTAIFRFAVTSHSDTQVAAGLDVASSSGTLGAVAVEETQLLLSDLTHKQPKANNSSGQAIFEFTWRAPESSGTYTLFGAGCSVNGNSAGNGDAAARTTYEVVVGAGIPTFTPTPPVSTPTATLTATATETPTANGQTCVGDCDGDGEVTVDELITGVNIALGVTPPSTCPVFDANGDEEVTVEEILQAVNSALHGCPL